MQRPSNTTTTFFLIVVLIVAGIIIFSARDSQKDKANLETLTASPTILTLQRNTESSTIDTDGDGLADWEETLRFSDPKNPDTDGDGTLDGAEVAEGRDPTVAGPNDTLEEVFQNKLDEFGPIYENYVQGSLTDQFATNFIQNYLQHNEDALYESDIEPQLINKLVTDVDNLTELPVVYSTADLETFPFDRELIHDYGNNFAIVQEKLINRLITLQNNTSPEIYLNNLSIIYIDTAEELSNVAVPYSLVELHMGVLNNFARVSKVFSTISKNDKIDPIRSLFAIKDYNESVVLQEEIYTIIKKYFDDNGIIFTTEETGNFWNNI